jgi:hypothetical protein
MNNNRAERCIPMTHTYFSKAFFVNLQTLLAFFIHLLQIQVQRCEINHARDITLHRVMNISPAEFPTNLLISSMRSKYPANLPLLALIT